MTHGRSLIILLSALLLLSAAAGRRPARAGAADEQRTVRLIVSTKGEDEPAPTLRPEDLRVTEGGVERRVVSLAGAADAPLHVALLIDVSGSQEYLIETSKAAAADFVKTALRPGRDRAAVVSFANKTVVHAPLTDDLSRAAGALARVKFEPPPGYVGRGVVVAGAPLPADQVTNSTSFWDAVGFVSREVFESAPGGDAARVVVLLSDGWDTSSQTKKKAALESLVGAGVVVYSVGVGDTETYSGLNKDALRKVAEESGGLAVFPAKRNDLRAAFAVVRETLRARYLLTYASPAEAPAKSPRKLKVEIVSPELRRQGLRVSYPPRPATAPR
jgi:VWFA-related protein